MTRNRQSAKAAGARHNRTIADYLATHIDDRIDKRALTGAKDKGDITGWRTHAGGRIVAELKDYGGRYHVGEWLTEAETERTNDDAIAGLVIAKRRGHAHPGSQVVFLTLDDLIALLTDTRPGDQP